MTFNVSQGWVFDPGHVMPKTGAGLVQVLVCIPPGVLPAGSHVNGDQALNPTSTAQKPTTQQFYRRNNVDKTLHELANHHVVSQRVFVREVYTEPAWNTQQLPLPRTSSLRHRRDATISQFFSASHPLYSYCESQLKCDLND